MRTNGGCRCLSNAGFNKGTHIALREMLLRNQRRCSSKDKTVPSQLLFQVSELLSILNTFSAIGEPANVVCYSGGKEIYRGRSSGKLMTEQGSDGWYFREEPSKFLIRVSGACVIVQQTDESPHLQWPTQPDGG